MENESGAKIAIRGKGSVKEGKGKSDAAHASNQDEDLHCLIMADTEDKVNKAKKLIHNVIETVRNLTITLPRYPHRDPTDTDDLQAASIPEGQNELKRNQLRELAALNGTLRDDENQACQNCGEIGHRKYDCPQARNFTANIICRVCGNAGHMARDCPDRARGQDPRNFPPRAAIGGPEGDYERLMIELGGGEAPAPAAAGGAGNGGPPMQNGSGGGDNLRPWERKPTGAPAPWQQRQEPTGGPAPWQQRAQPTGGPAPWANNNNRGGHDGGYGGGGRDGGYGGGGYGGGGGGYNSGPPQQGGAAPWMQQQQGGGGYGGGGGGQAPWQRNGPRGGDDVPPPPPPPPGGSEVPPPPPPA